MIVLGPCSAPKLAVLIGPRDRACAVTEKFEPMSLNAMWPLLRAVNMVRFPARETRLMQQKNASRSLGSSYPLTDSVFYAYTLRTIVAVNFLFMLPGCKPRLHSEIPYDHSNPIVYDNDSSEDTYTDELLMALHTAGRIELRGMITTVGGWRDPWEPTDLIARHQISARSELVSKARRSGMTRVPLPVAGPSDSIAEPPSGRIEDTTEQRTGAAKLIVAEAALASAQRPLVVVVGGPVSSIADAFLLDPSIADRVIVAWAGGRNWNGGAEPFHWATEVVLRNFTCVLFDEVMNSAAPRWISCPSTSFRIPNFDDS